MFTFLRSGEFEKGKNPTITYANSAKFERYQKSEQNPKEIALNIESEAKICLRRAKSVETI